MNLCTFKQEHTQLQATIKCLIYRKQHDLQILLKLVVVSHCLQQTG